MNNPAESLVFSEIDLIEQMNADPEGFCRNLGGRPFGIVCKPGRQRRYRRMANYLGLQLFESDKVTREDGFVLIHAGELAQWVTLGTAP